MNKFNLDRNLALLNRRAERLSEREYANQANRLYGRAVAAEMSARADRFIPGDETKREHAYTYDAIAYAHSDDCWCVA